MLLFKIRLPKEVISLIFQFDSTFHIFGNNDFKNELTYNYLNNKVLLKKCRNNITNYLNSLIYDECIWYNEYGKIDINNELLLIKPNYTSISDFRIELHYINNVLYYKVLPRNLFINKFNKYDGYFLDENMKNNLSKTFLDKLSISSTDKIYYFDINNKIIVEQISMYF
jgi:hypothetical protein